MPAVLDQMGRRVQVPDAPQRIVSVVPSQTELLFDLGVERRVAGVTRYCEFPERARLQCADVGGTKKLNFAAIEALQPDLILGNKEENARDDIARLAERYPVWMSDISDLDDALAMCTQIGAMVQAVDAARQLTQDIEAAFDRFDRFEPARVAYFIWRKPWMVVGRDTFIDDVLNRCGLQNAFSDRSRYPEVSESDLSAAAPDWVFLSSEPFPFDEQHVDEMQRLLPNSRVCVVDGTYFSWYGSRLAQSGRYLQSLRESLIA